MNRRSFRQGSIATATALLLPVWLLANCTTSRIALNSEMIRAKFGSYGVQVVKQTPEVRVSLLYSESEGVKIIRTFAVVLFPATVADGLRSAHEQVLAGGSLGATLVAAGWQLAKHPMAYQTIQANNRLAELMQVAPGTPLATHLYSTVAKREDVEYGYAWIAEIHHPSHLTRADLARIYGSFPLDRKLKDDPDHQLERLNERLYEELHSGHPRKINSTTESLANIR